MHASYLASVASQMKLASVEEALAAKEKKLVALKRRKLGEEGDGPELILSLRQKLTYVESEVTVRHLLSLSQLLVHADSLSHLGADGARAPRSRPPARAAPHAAATAVLLLLLHHHDDHHNHRGGDDDARRPHERAAGRRRVLPPRGGGGRRRRPPRGGAQGEGRSAPGAHEVRAQSIDCLTHNSVLPAGGVERRRQAHSPRPPLTRPQGAQRVRGGGG